MPWYIIKTNYRKTLLAHEFYQLNSLKSYIPTKRVKLENGRSKINLLLKGFVFLYFKDGINYNLINQNPYTSDVIRYNSKPIEIPELQMETMINHVESVYGDKHFSNLKKGDYIIVNHGILQGVKGKIIEICKNKIYLNINSLSATMEINYSR